MDDYTDYDGSYSPKGMKIKRPYNPRKRTKLISYSYIAERLRVSRQTLSQWLVAYGGFNPNHAGELIDFLVWVGKTKTHPPKTG